MTNVPSLSGNEITDLTRRMNVQGDGLLPEQGSTGIWEATTNLDTNGGFETNTTGWNNVSIASLTRILTQFKFGAACGQIVTSNAAANEGVYHNFTATVAVYTVSAWVRGAAGGTVRMAVRDNVGANPQTGAAVTLSGQWQRITLITTALTAATWRCYVETDVQQNITFQIDGVQVEQQPLATPYVETDGGSATRSLSLVSVPAAGIMTSGVQGWMAARVRFGWSNSGEPAGGSGFPNYLRLIGGTYATVLYYNESANGFGVARQTPTGADSPNNALAVAAGNMATLIASFTATTVASSVNGGNFSAAGNTNDIGTPVTIQIGDAAGLADSDFYWVALGSGTLTDADAARIAGFNNDPVIANFPGTPTWFWDSGPDGTQVPLVMGQLGTGRV